WIVREGSGDRGLSLDSEAGDGSRGLRALPLAAPDARTMRRPRASISGMAEAKAAAIDTIKFFGHEPASHSSEMPSVARRGEWWAILPEYGRYHQEHSTALARGSFTWLEVRPELVISPMLKSLVQPGFE